MGNGVSSQGNVHPHDQGDIRSSVTPEQHDWQPESAVASRQETLSLQSTRKSYRYTSESVTHEHTSVISDLPSQLQTTLLFDWYQIILGG